VRFFGVPPGIGLATAAQLHVSTGRFSRAARAGPLARNRPDDDELQHKKRLYDRWLTWVLVPVACREAWVLPTHRKSRPDPWQSDCAAYPLSRVGRWDRLNERPFQWLDRHWLRSEDQIRRTPLDLSAIPTLSAGKLLLRLRGRGNAREFAWADGRGSLEYSPFAGIFTADRA